MDKTFSILGVVLLCASVSLAQFCACPQNYDPVCATDGKTYPNSCELNCKRRSNSWLEQVQRGPCGKPDRPQPPREPDLPCICPANYDPVCATDGKTYPNSCELNCKRRSNSWLEQVQRGPCGKPDRPQPPRAPDVPCICPANYQPVCGDNKKTYPNRCELNCARGIRLAYHGSCKGSYNNY